MKFMLIIEKVNIALNFKLRSTRTTFMLIHFAQGLHFDTSQSFCQPKFFKYFTFQQLVKAYAFSFCILMCILIFNHKTVHHSLITRIFLSQRSNRSTRTKGQTKFDYCYVIADVMSKMACFQPQKLEIRPISQHSHHNCNVE